MIGTGTAVRPGVCLLHGSFVGSACPTCCSTVLPLSFAGLPYDRQPSSVPTAPMPQPGAWICPRCGVVNAWFVRSCSCRPKPVPRSGANL